MDFVELNTLVKGWLRRQAGTPADTQIHLQVTFNGGEAVSMSVGPPKDGESNEPLAAEEQKLNPDTTLLHTLFTDALHEKYGNPFRLVRSAIERQVEEEGYQYGTITLADFKGLYPTQREAKRRLPGVGPKGLEVLADLMATAGENWPA